MKQPRKLTRSEKIIISNNGLNATNWMLVEDLGAYLKIINKTTGTIKMVTKYPKKVREKSYAKRSQGWNCINHSV